MKEPIDLKLIHRCNNTPLNVVKMRHDLILYILNLHKITSYGT